MTKRMWIGLAMVSMVVAVAWLALERVRAPRAGGGEVVPSVRAPDEEAPTPLRAEDERAALAAQEAERDAVEAPEPTPARASEAKDAAPPDTHARVVATLLDESGAPLSDAELAAVRGRERWSAESDPLGRVELAVPWQGLQDWSQQLVVSAPGRASAYPVATLRAGATTQLGELRLAFGASIRGRVLDMAGAPIDGARVAARSAALPRHGDEGVWRRHGPTADITDAQRERDAEPSTTTDADGRFVLDGLAPGELRLWAHADGMRYAWTDALALAPGETLEGVELALEPLRREDRIAGVVLDPGGAPVSNAWITAEHEGTYGTQRDTLSVDERGRFALIVAREVPHTLIAHERDRRFGDAAATGIQPGTLDLVLRFEEARTIELLVRDEAGEPFEQFGVGLVSSDERSTQVHTQPLATPGRAEVPVPALPFFVEVSAPGHRRERRGPFEPAAAPATLELVLRPLPALTGVVLADGEPVEGAEVELALASERWDLLASGFVARAVLAGGGEATTDAEGRFRMPYGLEGEFYVQAEAPGRAVGEVGPFLLDSTAPPGELAIELPRGGALEGQVLLPEGQDPAGTIVGIHRGDGRPRTQRVGADGRYRFELLTPGWYQVLRRPAELDPQSRSYGRGNPRRFEPSCEVFDARTTHFDLDLRTTGD